MPGHLPNYLKSHRIRSGLSQSEVAFLVGGCDVSRISRYEHPGILPPLDIALALEEIFRTPVAELFAGIYDCVGKEVGTRIEELIRDLEQRDIPARYRSTTQHKRGWLEEHRALFPDREDTMRCT
jgi:transcriptional regulator with XRE-family HTH domain